VTANLEPDKTYVFSVTAHSAEYMGAASAYSANVATLESGEGRDAIAKRCYCEAPSWYHTNQASRTTPRPLCAYRLTPGP